MVRVPVVTNTTVTTAPLSRARLPDTAGGLRSATQGFGRQIQDTTRAVADEAEQWQDSIDEGAAIEADTAFSSRLQDLLYDSENGFLYQRGRAAAEGLDGLRKEIASAYQETTADLSPGAARRSTQTLMARMDAAIRQAGSHSVSERDAWIVGSAGARRERALIDATNAYADPQIRAGMMALSETEIHRQAATQGWSADETALALTTSRSTFHASITGAFLDGRDVPGAMDYFEAHEGDMTPVDRARLLPVIREGQVEYGAAQAVSAALSGSTAPVPTVEATRGADGFYQAPGVSYSLGPIRDEPVAGEIVGALSGIAQDLGVGVTIISGGQPSVGRDGVERTGSHRHDVNDEGLGGAADLVLTRNGQTVLPGDDPELYERFFEAAGAVPSLTGMGSYGGHVHVGGGDTAFWGPDGSADTAVPEFRDAAERGRTRGGATTIVGEATGTRGDPMAAIEAISDPEVRQRAFEMLDERTKRQEAAASAAEEELRISIYQRLEQGTRWEDIPFSERTSLTPEHMRAARSYASSRASGPIRTDFSVYRDITAMQVAEPEEFLRLDLTTYQDRLASADVRRLIDAQTAMLENDTTHPSASFAQIRSSFEAIAPGVLDFSAERDTTDGQEAGAAQAAMVGKIQDFVAREDRQPTPIELGEMANELLLPMMVPTYTANTILPALSGMDVAEIPAYQVIHDVEEALRSGEGYTLPGLGGDAATLTASKIALIAESLEARGLEADIEDVVRFWLKSAGGG